MLPSYLIAVRRSVRRDPVLTHGLDSRTCVCLSMYLCCPSYRFAPCDRRGGRSPTRDPVPMKAILGLVLFQHQQDKVFRIHDRHVPSVYPLSIGAVWGFRRLVSWRSRFTENPGYHIKPSHWPHNYGTHRPSSCRCD